MSKLSMRKGKVMGLALILMCITPLAVPAGDFDGSKPLTCAVIDVVECVPGGQCEERMPGHRPVSPGRCYEVDHNGNSSGRNQAHECH